MSSFSVTITPGLKFCWLCIIVYQYSETNVMHFLFNLLRIKGLYMFHSNPGAANWHNTQAIYQMPCV
jgi:hypothetical protein